MEYKWNFSSGAEQLGLTSNGNTYSLIVCMLILRAQRMNCGFWRESIKVLRGIPNRWTRGQTEFWCQVEH